MHEPQMAKIAELIDRALESADDDPSLARIRDEVRELTSQFPVYRDLLDEVEPI
jgi:glycine/serine hydroxymethyltransferase